MNMKRLLLLVAFFATLHASAQQVNPVPDYVFANRMSAGRNTVTDTAAYFSIGPRYGATRGMMPPMVVDTASFSANKRNGLLIFSVQKNKFLYWDSVGVKWAEMAGTAGSAITGSGVAGYMPEFTTTTNLDTTRLYHSAGRFAIGSTTTTNGVFNVYGGQSYFDTSIKIGSSTFLVDEGKNETYIAMNADSGAFSLQVNGSVFSNKSLYLSGVRKWELTAGETSSLEFINRNSNLRAAIIDTNRNVAFGSISSSAGAGANLYVNAISNEVYVGTTTDAGNFRLQVSGGIYTTAASFFAASGGNVGIGTTSPSSFLGANGTLTVQGPVPGILFSEVGTLSAFIATNGTQMVIDARTTRDMDFQVGDSRRLRITSSGELLINTITDAGDYRIQVAGNIYSTGSITTGAPSGGSIKPWKLGEAATVSPTSPNRTIRIEIDGTVYYLHAKTTND